MTTAVGKTLATFFGAGYWPKGPGTAGSIAAVLVAWALHTYAGWDQLAFMVLGILSMAPAIWASEVTARSLGAKDPQIVVVDEVVGQWITLSAAAHYEGAWPWVIGLVLFRVFDIVKPWPVRQLEAVKPAGAGIVLDDVMAGVYGAAVLALLGWFKLY
mgnify:CR=1 FL=1